MSRFTYLITQPPPPPPVTVRGQGGRWVLGTLAGVCGIVAVIGGRDDREALAAPDAVALLAGAIAQLDDALSPARSTTAPETRFAGLLETAAASLREADEALRSLPGVRLLVSDAKCVLDIETALTAIDARIADVDRAVEAGDVLARSLDDPQADTDAQDQSTHTQIERVNAVLGELKDHAFALRRDRLRMARQIADLWGGTPPAAAIGGLWSIQVALSGLDRLEVRGRDSAGLQVFVRGVRLDASPPDPQATSHGGRLADRLFGAGAVRDTPNGVAFVYKTASEIGELGDNTAALRAQIRDDRLLRWALAAERAEVVVLSHTRWASIGIVSVPNAHPLDAWAESVGGDVGHVGGSDGGNVGHVGGSDGGNVGHVAAVLNGDVDNYADLIAQRRLQIPAEITTDARVIPTMVRQSLAASNGSASHGIDVSHADAEQLGRAFIDSASSFDGSVAIAAHAADVPDVLALALRGSGQALYVGAAGRSYVVASEPYGLVEECRTYVRLDGETPADVANPVGSRGQVMLIGTPAGAAAELTELRRFSYDGSELPVGSEDVVAAEVTTRDIDRGDNPHFLLKEIREAPRSLRATLRGRIDTATLRGRIDTATLRGRIDTATLRGRIGRIGWPHRDSRRGAERAFRT